MQPPPTCLHRSKVGPESPAQKRCCSGPSRARGSEEAPHPLHDQRLNCAQLQQWRALAHGGNGALAPLYAPPLASPCPKAAGSKCDPARVSTAQTKRGALLMLEAARRPSPPARPKAQPCAATATVSPGLQREWSSRSALYLRHSPLPCPKAAGGKRSLTGASIAGKAWDHNAPNAS